jgi:protein SCO1/2
MRTVHAIDVRRPAGRRLRTALLFAALLLTCGVQSARAQRSMPEAGTAASQPVPILKEIGIDQKLDAKLPLEAEFSDEQGASVKLGQFFGQRPVVLALVYYQCPMLCTQILSGLAGSLQGVTFTVGKEYEVVVVSFDPGETPAMAVERKKNFVSRFIRGADPGHVHFLTGRESSIKALTGAVGFRYAYDQATGQFAHPASIMIATPDGRMSRYLYGVEFAPRDLKLALVEASAGQIGTVVDQALLFCYHYDPETGRYGIVIMNFMRAAGALTVLALGAWIVLSLRREHRNARALAPTSTAGTR